MSVDLRQKAISKGRKSLYLDIYENGSRQYEFLKLYLLPSNSTENRQSNKETLKLAEAIRAKREIELKNEEYGFTAGFKKKANFVEYFKTFGESRTAQNTKNGYNTTYQHLKEYTAGTLAFSAITAKWLDGFKKHLLNVVSANSVNIYFVRLKAAYRQAAKEKIVSGNPFAEMERIKTTQSKTEFLEQAEIELLIKTPCKNAEVKRAFLFCCFTGLRYSDVCSLKWKNLKTGSIEIFQQKSKQPVSVPLSDTALQILGKTGEPEKKVFKMPDAQWTGKVMRDWSKKAKLKKEITFHVSRHTFATLSLTLGADLYTVSKLLGHSRIETTTIYAKVIDAKRKQAIQLLPKLELPESLKVSERAA